MKGASEADIRRFWSKVDKNGPNGCWLWLAGKDAKGYGRFWLRTIGNNWAAHRFAYWLIRGSLDDALVIDHLCRNHACVNPGHMEQVTLQENVRRGVSPSSINRAKTHCIRGHPFDADNTLPTKDGRACRTCAREKTRLRRWSQRCA